MQRIRAVLKEAAVPLGQKYEDIQVLNPGGRDQCCVHNAGTEWYVLIMSGTCLEHLNINRRVCYIT